MKENPIIDSVFLIQKLEICRDIYQCYLWAQGQLGEQFEEQMAMLTKTIREHQFAHEEELSFFSSAWLMIMTDLPGEGDEAENAEQDAEGGSWLGRAVSLGREMGPPSSKEVPTIERMF